MTRTERALLGLVMTLALGFGFLHHLVPGYAHDFDRLHVFLFNLCAGGTILVHEAGRRRASRWLWPYFGLAVLYALGAFLELYWAPIVLAVPLLLLVERARVRRFGTFVPWRLFRSGQTADKFLEAALLCLSIGLGLSALVMLNHAYLPLVELRKLTLEVFFLGFSFPLSLLTMSVMFRFADERGGPRYPLLKEVGFWSITLGVVVFFLFILFEVHSAEVLLSGLLLAAVCLVCWLFVAHSWGAPRQQRAILLSALGFLLVTAVLGVAYLLAPVCPALGSCHPYSMSFHATLALYGWNLSGLFVVARSDDFPLARRIWPALALHWATAALLAPAGRHLPVAAALALPVYALLVFALLLGPSGPGAEARPAR